MGGPATESNGVGPAVKSARPAFLAEAAVVAVRPPGRHVLAVLAIVLEFQRWTATAGFTFVVAFAAIVAGLVGLILHYRRERLRAASEDEEEPAAPRIHRQTTCRIEPPLIDRLVRAVKTLHQHAQEKNWSPDWKSYEEHMAAAESLLQQDDLARRVSRILPSLVAADPRPAQAATQGRELPTPLGQDTVTNEE